MSAPALRAAGTGARTTRPGGHPDWCGQGHHCGLGEHRAQPVTLAVPGRGVVVLTRVQAASGRQYAEVRTRIRLADGEHPARQHLGLVLLELARHLRRLARLPIPS